MKHLLIILLGFGLIGCDGSIDTQIKGRESVFTCSCEANKSSGNMCTWNKGVGLKINKSVNDISLLLDDFKLANFDNLQISSNRYFAVAADGDSISIDRGSLQLTYKHGRYSGGGKVIEVYQCNEVKI